MTRNHRYDTTTATFTVIALLFSSERGDLDCWLASPLARRALGCTPPEPFGSPFPNHGLPNQDFVISDYDQSPWQDAAPAVAAVAVVVVEHAFTTGGHGRVRDGKWVERMMMTRLLPSSSSSFVVLFVLLTSWIRPLSHFPCTVHNKTTHHGQDPVVHWLL